MRTRLQRRKWAHPLKGQSIREALADALTEKLGSRACAEDIWENRAPCFRYLDCARWGWDSGLGVFPRHNVHSWDRMRDCLKYGFDFLEGKEEQACARSTDEDEKAKEEADESHGAV